MRSGDVVVMIKGAKAAWTGSVLLAVFWTLPSDAAPVDFVREVRPIFEARCYECHGDGKRKSGLRLDVKAAALRGGDNHGPDIVPGQPEASPLLHFVTAEDEDEVMPPQGDRLTPAEVAVLTRWIAEGAVWPDGVDAVTLRDPADHWSFQPLRAAPAGASVDSFIDAKLAAHGLSRSPPADPATLLRRITLDLTGLPPTLEEIEAFAVESVRDASSAFRHAAERLLASPRHGERWAQHWLDVVRYADTHGFEVNTERPHAFPYRDYVIDAFHRDLPYDRFIREQIAGDVLGADAATGFLVTASVLLPGQIGKDAASMRLARQDALDEIVTNIGQTFLGLSIGCARCHDHKFDPVTALDYYGMQAFVAGVEYGDRELRTPAALQAKREAEALRSEVAEIDRRLLGFVPLAGSGTTRAMVSPRQNVERFHPVKAKRVRFTILATNRLEPCLDEVEVFGDSGENLALASRGAVVRSSGDIIVADRHDPKYLNDGRPGNSRSWMGNAVRGSWVEIEFPQALSVDRVVWGRDRTGQFQDRLAVSYRLEVADADGVWKSVADSSDRRAYQEGTEGKDGSSTEGLSAAEAAEAKALRERRDRLEREAKAKDGTILAFAGTFRSPDEIRLLRRGDPEQPGEVVPPRVPAALGQLVLDPATPEPRRRLALADWIADPGNPLTARVMANRVWQGHFGTGLVASPNDFGNNGTPPSHPELLDWLAAEFIRSGWSVKHLHRLIVTSETYRQGTRIDAAASGIDAENRLLWRFPSRRLEAEAIRDSILAVSGRLDPKRFGRGFDLFDKRGGLSGFNPVESPSGEGLRRMIYAHKVRREPEAVFGAFDCPDAGQAVGQRRESTTPIQALNLFNSRFTLDQAAAFADRVLRESGPSVEQQVRHAYRLALSREPDPREAAEVRPVVAEHGVEVLGRALWNSNEFVFLP
jgi:mono/diheme cytochrome c family protein